jgi:hypothetical protein
MIYDIEIIIAHTSQILSRKVQNPSTANDHQPIQPISQASYQQLLIMQTDWVWYKHDTPSLLYTREEESESKSFTETGLQSSVSMHAINIWIHSLFTATCLGRFAIKIKSLPSQPIYQTTPPFGVIFWTELCNCFIGVLKFKALSS